MESGVGLSGEEPKQWRRFLQLEKLATEAELVGLTDYPNSVVRCYALWALADRQSPAVFAVVRKYLYDKQPVSWLSGCTGGEWPVSATLFFYRQSYGYKLTAREKATIDSLIQFDPNVLILTVK